MEGGVQCDQIGRFITLWGTFQLFCPNCQTILGHFCKFVKIFHFTSKILFGRLLWTFGDFLLVTLLVSNEKCVIALGARISF